jgi:acyl-CoA thioesterase YciA
MELISTHSIMMSDIGVNDNLFGGRLVAWIDTAAAVFAKQKIRSFRIVTKKIADLLFIKPAKVNTLLKIYGEVANIGRTSITVNIEARRVDVVLCEEEVMCTTTLTFVNVDEEGKPTPILIEQDCGC